MLLVCSDAGQDTDPFLLRAICCQRTLTLSASRSAVCTSLAEAIPSSISLEGRPCGMVGILWVPLDIPLKQGFTPALCGGIG